MRETRQVELLALLDDLEKIRTKDPEPDEIITELGTVIETLKTQSVEVGT